MSLPAAFVIAMIVLGIYFPPMAMVLAVWFCIAVNQKR